MQVPVSLKAHPELWRRFEQASEAERCIRRDAALAQHDLVQPIQRDVELTRGLHLTQLERLQELLEQDFAGATVGPSQFGSLVIVFDRDFEGMPVLPSKRHTILVVHANAVSPFHAALQGLQSVAWWRFGGRPRARRRRASSTFAAPHATDPWESAERPSCCAPERCQPLSRRQTTESSTHSSLHGECVIVNQDGPRR